MPKILLVEDDNNLREIFEMRLQAEGYDTLTAGNGEEGLTVAMKERPDLIISDVMMPKLSGFEMLETLRSAPEGKDIKVIMMTALGQAEDQARGEKLGVIKYLVKSQATLDDFARVVREVLPPADQAGAAPSTSSIESSQTNQPEGNNKMPEDPVTPTPADPAKPPADNPMPSPSADPAAPAPTTGAVAGDQQSTSEEASAVQGQINDFVANTPTEGSTAPSADSMTPPAEPAAATDTSSSFAPSMPAAADTPANPMAAPGAPDMGMPSTEATSTDAPAVPPATPPADTPPAVAPQTDAPADASGTTPPADSSTNAI